MCRESVAVQVWLWKWGCGCESVCDCGCESVALYAIASGHLESYQPISTNIFNDNHLESVERDGGREIPSFAEMRS